MGLIIGIWVCIFIALAYGIATVIYVYKRKEGKDNLAKDKWTKIYVTITVVSVLLTFLLALIVF